MAEHWVINASPIILLAKADIVHMLPDLCDEIVIPTGVVREVQLGEVADSARNWLAATGRRFIRPAPAIHETVAKWHGGSGEMEVISWALLYPEFTAVLDDRAARSFATQRGVKVLGSLRIIVLAKERGLLRQAKPALEKLRGPGAYVSDELLDLTISLAGEE